MTEISRAIEFCTNCEEPQPYPRDSQFSFFGLLQLIFRTIGFTNDSVEARN